ncbi:MAG: PAS domain S-box protein, partial [Gemmatimonadaceae bacterium]
MAAAAVLALGVLGGLGALFDSTVMSRPLRAFPAASLGGSIGSLGLGFALLGWSTARRWLLRGGSALAVFVGGLPLLVRALTPEGSPPAGTFIPSLLRDVPATTGLFLLLGGLGLLALSARRRRRLAHVLAGVCGSTALLLAITVSIGRLTGFLEGTDGSLLNGASVYTLLVGAINGAMLMSLAAGYQESTWPVATWLPNTIGISVAVTVIFIWLALVDREDEQMQRQIDLASVLAAGNVRAELLRAMNGVDRLAIRVAVRSPAIDAALIEQTALLLKDDAQPLVAAAWPSSDQIGDTSHVIVVPSENPYKEVLTSAVQRQMRNPIGRDSANARPLDFFNVPNQHEVFAIGVRDCLGTPCRAPSAYVFDARRAFRGLLADSLTGFYLAVRLDTQRVVRSGLTSKTKAKWLRSTNIDLPAEGARWQITVWPTPATIARARTDLPAGVLVLGLALAMLLPVTLRLADTAWSAAARAERARVNTALESATDSLWVWDIANDTIERGSALWSRLGYPTPSGPVALSAWIALVHPKDQDAVRQAMSRHLAGSTESMELEYRVRDADDKWHWLVERGRLVERTEKGTPLRALGVTADITERKNADDALAASERKYRATFDSASQMKALLDDAGRIVEMNPAGRALCGASEGAIGRPIWEFPAFHGSQA